MRVARWAVLTGVVLMLGAGAVHAAAGSAGGQAVKLRAHAIRPAPSAPDPRPHGDGRITGSVTDTNGVPLAGILVVAANAETGILAPVEAATGADGSFVLGPLPVGPYVVLTRRSDGFVDELFNDLPCPNFACDLAEGEVVWAAAECATEAVFELERGEIFSGLIQGTDTAAGLPEGQAWVEIYDSGGSRVGDTYPTDALGNYVSPALPEGEYFIRTRNLLGYLNLAWDGVDCNPCDVTATQPITLTLGGDYPVPFVNFTLEPGGRIAGSIAANGVPVGADDAGVAIYNSAGAWVTRAATGPDGTYVSPDGLLTGEYFVVTWNRLELGDEVYDNLPCGGCDPTTGTPVPALTGQTTFGVTFDLEGGPTAAFDLRVSLSAPGGAAAGASITVSDVTKNAGPDAAPASTTVFILSADGVLDAGDLVLGQREVPGLEPGQCLAGSSTLVIPADTAPGEYVLFAMADGLDALEETDETNNVSNARTIRIGFDLAALWIRVPPGAGPGAVLTVASATKNLGPGVAPASTTVFFLSADAAWDPGDAAVGSQAVEALPPWGLSAGVATVTLPGTLAPGTYYLIARADGPGELAETVETNNTVARAIRVGFDLIVAPFWAPPGAGPGATIHVFDQTRNLGPGGAPASTTVFFLSGDPLWDAGDLRLGQRAVGALSAWSGSGATTPLVLPSDTAPGAYFLIAVADGEAALDESAESNNAAARPLRVGFDLMVYALAAPGWAGRGTQVTIDDSTKNLGPGASPETMTAYYLSRDPVVDGGDVRLGERAIPALPAWGRSTGSVRATIPADVAPGAYYLIAVVDGAGLLAESNETNNVKLRGLVIK